MSASPQRSLRGIKRTPPSRPVRAAAVGCDACVTGIDGDLASLAEKRSAVEESRGDFLEAGDAPAAAAAEKQLAAIDREASDLRQRRVGRARDAEKVRAALGPHRAAVPAADHDYQYWGRVARRRDELELSDRIFALLLEADPRSRFSAIERARDMIQRRVA